MKRIPLTRGEKKEPRSDLSFTLDLLKCIHTRTYELDTRLLPQNIFVLSLDCLPVWAILLAECSSGTIQKLSIWS